MPMLWFFQYFWNFSIIYNRELESLEITALAQNGLNPVISFSILLNIINIAYVSVVRTTV